MGSHKVLFSLLFLVFSKQFTAEMLQVPKPQVQVQVPDPQVQAQVLRSQVQVQVQVL